MNGSAKIKKTEIVGDLILLRYAEKGDLADYTAFLEDKEMMVLTGSFSVSFTAEQNAAWLERIGQPGKDRVDFMIVPKDSKRLIGEVVLNDIDWDNRSANIRIAIGSAHGRGKGYGQEAMRRMVEYGFRVLGLHRIHLGVYTFNPRAIHVYEKIGFKHEGIERDALYQDGEYHDMIRMAILEHEFKE
ncbi:GNAT family N-acetyltransferase [Paenibacillus physcomitrellae]|uniref:N-acetyltransferase n=1 Tax=Paenibacillus physcomitrellae TaxID=1619311 RepID=A0ABQ1FLS7_9BACL|nr:GNAT family protein [Paenibacillus physcomitrellae]GGA21228.1 N-acetyltransferase [Paenibacillus physcomitrellae]